MYDRKTLEVLKGGVLIFTRYSFGTNFEVRFSFLSFVCSAQVFACGVFSVFDIVVGDVTQQL